MGLSDSNITPGLTTLLCPALDHGKMFGIALYCRGTFGGVVVLVGLWDSNTTPGYTFSALPLIVAILNPFIREYKV